MTQNELNNENIITLLDDDDNPIDFEIIEMLEIGGKRYAFLLPLNDENADTEADEDEAVIPARTARKFSPTLRTTLNGKWLWIPTTICSLMRTNKSNNIN